MPVEKALPEFPPDSSFYSVTQTSRHWRALYLVSLAAGAVTASSLIVSSYIGGGFRLEPAAIPVLGVVLVLMLILVWVGVSTRPFVVREGNVQLVSPVRLRSGERRRSIQFSEIREDSLSEDHQRSIQVWVTLNDGTRFCMISMSDELGKDFARRFNDLFRDRGGHTG